MNSHIHHIMDPLIADSTIFITPYEFASQSASTWKTSEIESAHRWYLSIILNPTIPQIIYFREFSDEWTIQYSFLELPLYASTRRHSVQSGRSRRPNKTHTFILPEYTTRRTVNLFYSLLLRRTQIRHAKHFSASTDPLSSNYAT